MLFTESIFTIALILTSREKGITLERVTFLHFLSIRGLLKFKCFFVYIYWFPWKLYWTSSDYLYKYIINKNVKSNFFKLFYWHRQHFFRFHHNSSFSFTFFGTLLSPLSANLTKCWQTIRWQKPTVSKLFQCDHFVGLAFKGLVFFHLKIN